MRQVQQILTDAGHVVSFPYQIPDLVRKIAPIWTRRHQVVHLAIELADLKTDESRPLAEQLMMVSLFAWEEGQEDLADLLVQAEAFGCKMPSEGPDLVEKTPDQG